MAKRIPRTEFQIATQPRCPDHRDVEGLTHCVKCWCEGTPGRATQVGYQIGDFACAKGKWFYEYTHLPTGTRVCIHPAPERLPQALEELAALAAGTHERSGRIEDATRGRAWGGVLIGPKEPKGLR